MSNYPNAYCVKCGDHTDTQQKHTVVLQSNARALHGKCPKCGSEVFKFLPKKSKQGSKIESLKKPRTGATVTSLHEVRNKRRASDSLTGLENKVLAMETKQPIDYILLALGTIAAVCLLYLIYR